MASVSLAFIKRVRAYASINTAPKTLKAEALKEKKLIATTARAGISEKPVISRDELGGIYLDGGTEKQLQRTNEWI